MNIGQAARASGLSSKAIRHYEDLGLVVPMRDQNNDYRVYSGSDIERLRFLQRARAAGLGLDECSELLGLYVNADRRCSEVKSLLVDKISRLDQQLSVLNALRGTLVKMAEECAGDNGNSNVGVPLTAVEGVPANKSVAMAFTLLGESDSR
ncbi:MerR family transcriptional regulator [Cellvibrio mixtus]|uniref:MerR family transcriptional regulator n=1 Tax=Cellvibrio mixtus TaxID=39650 RepID=UPI000587F868|nr:MerR family transcriptional regulator [Cellvibrio mixtus]